MSSRQLCNGSRRQSKKEGMDGKVTCPECTKQLAYNETVKVRLSQQETAQDAAVRHMPVIPSHLPDREGQLAVELKRSLRRRGETTPNPFHPDEEDY